MWFQGCLFRHLLNLGLHTKPRPPHIDLLHTIKILDHVLCSLRKSPRKPRTIHRIVQSSELGHPRLHDFIHGGLVRNIARANQDFDFGAYFKGELFGLLEALGVEIYEDYAAA